VRTVFISDLHLGDHSPEIEQLFHHFMEQLLKPTDTLYILGDFFEAWIGDDAQTDLSVRVIEALSKHTSNGGTGYFMHGNRDFLIGSEFCSQTGFQLIEEPYAITLGTQQCTLLHGDSLCTDDVEYQKFKTMVRDTQWQAEFLSKPIEERLAVARNLREKSQQSTQMKADEITDVCPQAVLQLFQDSKADIIIHGHTHRENRHQVSTKQGLKERIVLGDWGKTASVLIFDQDRLTLNNYSL